MSEYPAMEGIEDIENTCFIHSKIKPMYRKSFNSECDDEYHEVSYDGGRTWIEE